MNRFFTLGAAALLALGLTTGAAAAGNAVFFDFEQSDGGFEAIYADYPASAGADEFYELRHGRAAVPIDGAGNGLFLSGNNHSDDLFMAYYKKLGGFVPGQLYEFEVRFRLATREDSGMMGVGCSPGSSVFVKGGVVGTAPSRAPDSLGTYRLSLDKGNQGAGGRDVQLLGNMEKTDAQRPGAYECKQFSFRAYAKAGQDGSVCLILGTDSGFEATSAYYLDDISIRWDPADENAALTRAQAAQMLYLASGGTSADPVPSEFPDVRPDAPYHRAVSWARQSGFLLGYTDGRFAPDAPMTTAQALTMLFRAFAPTGKYPTAAEWANARRICDPSDVGTLSEPVTYKTLSQLLAATVG